MILEIATYSPDAALAAYKAGAGRIELCSAPAEGGLTPSAGTIRLVRKNINIPLHVMIRPREGDFCYSDREFEVMLEDICIARQEGADGIVCGILDPNGEVDTDRMQQVMETSGPMNITFHRAFDMSCDLFRSMETLAGLGIRRILTSGGKSTALEGIAMIRELVRKSAGRIIIMPGSGINETNAELILKETGATELHLSAGRYVSGSMEFRNNGISMGNIVKIPEYDLLMPDPERIAAMNRIMKA